MTDQLLDYKRLAQSWYDAAVEDHRQYTIQKLKDRPMTTPKTAREELLDATENAVFAARTSRVPSRTIAERILSLVGKRVVGLVEAKTVDPPYTSSATLFQIAAALRELFGMGESE